MVQVELPVVDISSYRCYHNETGSANGSNASLPVDIERECFCIAQALARYGAVVIRDATVSAEENNAFIELMASYFAHPDKAEDARPQLNYQVGWTPAFTERPRPIPADFHGDAPVTPRPQSVPPITSQDPKERFLWRIGPRPATSRFPEQNAPPVVPRRFAERWSQIMDRWGHRLLDAIQLVAEMVALGLGLGRDAFTSRMKDGPHLLAPTGSNLSGLLDRPNTVLAGFHYDLCFLTIHGKSNAPGLYLWTREGSRFPAKVPPGCLLVQAGLELEWLTGGLIQRGYHEVVADEAALALAKAHMEQQHDATGKQRRPFWRISSTLFAHIASDQVLEPLAGLAGVTDSSRVKYPPILAGDLVRRELMAISLCPSATATDTAS